MHRSRSSAFRRTALAVFAALGVLGAPGPIPAAAGAQARPLPPDAQLLLRADFDVRVLEAMAAATPVPGPRAWVYAVSADAGGELHVDAFVRGARGVEQQLRARGARVGTRAGDWVTIRVPLERLAEVAAAPGVRSLEIARRARFYDDSSLADIRAAGVRQRPVKDLFEGATGRGAIVGFVDTGIDFTHPDFYEDDSERSRVLYIWDQTARGSGPAGVGGDLAYGVECTQAQITRTGSSCAQRDVDGHGTHVAGIAASDGSGTRRGAPTYAHAGVAPGAEIIAVKTDLSFASIVDGVDYIFRRAAQLGRPAVVNLSLGAQFGPHDGTEAPSLAIDALTGPGKIVVVAAGNEGDNRTGGPTGVFASQHGEATAAAPGASATVEFRIDPYTQRAGGANDLVLLQTYYTAADSFDLTIVRPNGTTVTLPAAGGTAISSNAGGGMLVYQGTVAGDSVLGAALETGSLSPTSTSRLTSLYLGEWTTGLVAPAAGTWRLVFTRRSAGGPGTVDAYLSLYTLTVVPTFTTGASNRKLIGTPGDAHTVITVGGYSTRLSWPSVDGNTYRAQTADSVPNGELLLFGSPGPTRDGRLKPEISAPGRVFSTMSAAAKFPVSLIAPDSAHVIIEGTSMSAPHVAGAVALLLAKRPSLTPAQVLSALTQSARRDLFTARSSAGDAGAPNNSWGFGKLDVAGALALVPPATGRALMAVNPTKDSTTVRRSARGTVVALQSVRLQATDPESVTVTRIEASVGGRDRGFRLGVAIDVDRDGLLGANEPVVATSDSVELSDTRDVAVVAPAGTIVVPRGGTLDLLLVGVLSGGTPNATEFRASLDVDDSRAQGMRSGIALSLGGKAGVSPAIRTTVLAQGETFNISQNPVRRGPLVINFSEPATSIELFDFTGRLVRSFRPGETERRIAWELDSDAGRPVANGVYVLVVDTGSGVVRRKFFVGR